MLMKGIYCRLRFRAGSKLLRFLWSGTPGFFRPHVSRDERGVLSRTILQYGYHELTSNRVAVRLHKIPTPGSQILPPSWEQRSAASAKAVYGHRVTTVREQK